VQTTGMSGIFKFLAGNVRDGPAARGGKVSRRAVQRHRRRRCARRAAAGSRTGLRGAVRQALRVPTWQRCASSLNQIMMSVLGSSARRHVHHSAVDDVGPYWNHPCWNQC
jgi:hypothetical protein